MSVSKATTSPACIVRLLDSWNQGFVRSPEASRRHSIHSPSCAIFTSCSTAHNWFSVIPGQMVSRMRAIAASHTSIESSSAAISSGDLTRRASSDRKSTRLNSSHGSISYAVFCLKKKKKKPNNQYHKKKTKQNKTKNN